MKLSNSVRTWLLGAACGGCALYFLASARESKPDPQPMLLERVQALGDLHTARYSFTRTFEHQTHLRPAQWLTPVPLAADVIQSATANRALVSVHGSVEAGIDMRRAQVRREGGGWLVLLPHPTVYEANSKGRVFAHKRSLFWSDPNIGLKAEHLAGDDFSRAARQSGILRLAKNEAVKRLTQMLSTVTQDPVTIQFAR